MKTSLWKITAPALAVSLAFSVPAASAESGNVSVASSVSIEKEVRIEKAVEPIENKVFAVNDETAAITAALTSQKALTLEEYSYYEKRISSLLDSLGEARQDITAVSKQYGDGSLQAAGVGVAIEASLVVALDTRKQLEAIGIQVEMPQNP